MTVKEALKIVLHDEFLADSIYTVRDSASGDRAPEYKDTNSWDLPRVKAFAEAVRVLEDYYRTL